MTSGSAANGSLAENRTRITEPAPANAGSIWRPANSGFSLSIVKTSTHFCWPVFPAKSAAPIAISASPFLLSSPTSKTMPYLPFSSAFASTGCPLIAAFGRLASGSDALNWTRTFAPALASAGSAVKPENCGAVLSNRTASRTRFIAGFPAKSRPETLTAVGPSASCSRTTYSNTKSFRLRTANPACWPLTATSGVLARVSETENRISTLSPGLAVFGETAISDISGHSMSTSRALLLRPIPSLPARSLALASIKAGPFASASPMTYSATTSVSVWL
ncbi:MAG: hypothetical protein BWZ10_02893 [candidate division BRC1 bacterium ADurb.BinA364]|nr:MAG: hypothetical protein BWZ10_02893 [candidate division BRC1 bacterium ADurb.BinA364]